MFRAVGYEFAPLGGSGGPIGRTDQHEGSDGIAGHIIVVVGMIAVSILIGMMVALILGLISKLLAGRMDGSPHLLGRVY